MNLLTEKVALVTGASRGIGAAIACVFAKEVFPSPIAAASPPPNSSPQLRPLQTAPSKFSTPSPIPQKPSSSTPTASVATRKLVAPWTCKT